ncbi:MAG TPA: hypothetical protein VFL95_01065 [Gemmatimonadales bacterium]|nr:hypothetical protein [Gemmatimonadales bacterium]
MLGILLIALLSGARPDSLPQLKKCGEANPPLGALTTSGMASFVVTRHGEVDTTSLVVWDVADGSGAGFRSALNRQLPACRFKAGRPDGHHDDSVRVAVHIKFAPDSMRWGPFRRATAADLLQPAAAAPLVNAGEIIKYNDPRLEEQPIASLCRQDLIAVDEVVVRQRIDGQPVGEAEPIGLRGKRPPPVQGTVLLRFVILPNAKLDTASIVIDQASNPGAAAAARAKIRDCDWIPGRIGGIPVAVEIPDREQF